MVSLYKGSLMRDFEFCVNPKKLFKWPWHEWSTLAVPMIQNKLYLAVIHKGPMMQDFGVFMLARTSCWRNRRDTGETPWLCSHLTHHNKGDIPSLNVILCVLVDSRSALILMLNNYTSNGNDIRWIYLPMRARSSLSHQGTKFPCDTQGSYRYYRRRYGNR